MNVKKYSHELGMMTGFFVKDLNTGASSMGTVLLFDDCRKFVKSGLIKGPQNGCNNQNAVQVVPEERKSFGTVIQLCMNDSMRPQRSSNQQIEAAQVCKVANTSTAIVRENSSFIDIETALLNYSGAPALQNGVVFVYKKITDIVDSKMSMGTYPAHLHYMVLYT